MITVSNPTNPVTVSTPVKEIIVVSGIQGIPGAQGATGPQGIVGATGPQGTAGVGAGASTVGQLTDVILASPVVDGSLLVYSTANNKWNSTINLSQQVLECGQY